MIKAYKNYILLAILSYSLLLPALILPKMSSASTLDASIQEKSFKTSDGVRLTYLSGGQGDEALIFIPGWLMPAEIFNSQLNYFSKNYQVLSLNPRSQGSSDIYTGKNLAELRARDIKELIKHTRANNFVLIGWSLGVMESLDYVNRFGDTGLKSLVLIDNSIGEGNPPKAGKRRTTNMNTSQFTNYIKGFVQAIFKTPQDPQFIETVEKSALRMSDTPSQAFGVLSKPYPREYYRDTVYATQKPIWYAITPRYTEQGILFSNKHPQGQMTIYDNAGHALFVDVADEFNRDLEQFLRKSH
jgi:microsomal epoxide hydrolase